MAPMELFCGVKGLPNTPIILHSGHASILHELSAFQRAAPDIETADCEARDIYLLAET